MSGLNVTVAFVKAFEKLEKERQLQFLNGKCNIEYDDGRGEAFPHTCGLDEIDALTDVGYRFDINDGKVMDFHKETDDLSPIR